MLHHNQRYRVAFLSRGVLRGRVERRLRLGGGVVGSVLVATLGSVHGTFLELMLRLRARVRHL